jgi:hypothetical protein
MRQRREVRLCSLHRPIPGFGAIDALFKRSDAAPYLPRDQFVAKPHPRRGVISRRQLPRDALLIGGKALEECLDNDVVSEDARSVKGINTGIAVVVPVEKILETINEPDWANERKRAILEQRKAGGAVADPALSPDSASLP